MNEIVLNQLSDKLYEIGKEIGFSKPIIRSNKYSSEIYIVNNCVKQFALQLEIDWRENNLFLYVVYLKNNQLPSENVIYRYEDGRWCRVFLEEIYRTQRPVIKDRHKRYSLDYLFDCFAFYTHLIQSNPVVLTDYYKSISDMSQP